MQFDKKDKFRCFRFVAYDESIEKAKEELKNDMVPFCYIIHQPEKDEGKEHAHFMIDYRNTTTVNHILKSWGHLGANGYIEPCLFPENAYKYLYHDQEIDSAKGKIEYSPDDIKCFNGFDPSTLKNYTEKEKMLLMDGVMAVANDNHIVEFAGLCEYLSTENRQLYSYVLNNHSLVQAYMTSHRHRNKKGSSASGQASA